MRLKKITVQSARIHDLFSTEISPSVTLILGKNGTGKTSILESVYYMCQGTSFRGRDRDMISHTTNRTEIVCILDDETARRASLTITNEESIKKTFTVSGKTTARLGQAHRQPVVLFEPDELRLINSSPERRRKFLDGVLSRLYPHYATVLARYQRTVLQRNELLKKRENTEQQAWENHLFTWDIAFAELAQQISTMRREFIAISNLHLSPLYSNMAGNGHHISTTYVSKTNQDNYRQKLIDQLHANKIADSYRGYTSVGPHRDDFVINLDGHPASETASRGEMRTIMLAYKLLEVQLQEEIYGTSPLILMDDVFSELDTAREQQLMAALKHHQTIITATDLRDELKIDAKIIQLT